LRSRRDRSRASPGGGNHRGLGIIGRAEIFTPAKVERKAAEYRFLKVLGASGRHEIGEPIS
jgi:hypothetical protein